MKLSYRYGAEASNGGVDVVLGMNPTEGAALGPDGALLADQLLSALVAMVALRREGYVSDDPALVREGKEFWAAIITDLDRRMLPAIEGIRDAAVRAHHAAGGSLADLGEAMNGPRPTAQYRRKQVMDRAEPTATERWAATPPPPIFTDDEPPASPWATPPADRS